MTSNRFAGDGYDVRMCEESSLVRDVIFKRRKAIHMNRSVGEWLGGNVSVTSAVSRCRGEDSSGGS